MKHDSRFEAICQDAKTRIRETTVREVKERMDRGEPILLIDVREESEWKQARIPGAIHVGKGIIERDIHKVTDDIDAEMFLYCGGGYRSALAADNLQKMGYTNVISMDGGIRGWKDAGHELETGEA